MGNENNPTPTEGANDSAQAKSALKVGVWRPHYGWDMNAVITASDMKEAVNVLTSDVALVVLAENEMDPDAFLLIESKEQGRCRHHYRRLQNDTYEQWSAFGNWRAGGEWLPIPKHEVNA